MSNQKLDEYYKERSKEVMSASHFRKPYPASKGVSRELKISGLQMQIMTALDYSDTSLTSKEIGNVIIYCTKNVHSSLVNLRRRGMVKRNNSRPAKWYVTSIGMKALEGNK